MSFNSQDTTQKTKGISKEDLEKLKSLEIKQTQFKNLVASSKVFSESEKAVATFDSVERFNTFWQRTNHAKQDFDQRHQRGCGLWSKKYQASATEVQNFMGDFSPIIEIVQAFGTPYGGLAVGTISILLVVAASKDRLEESLASAISTITDRLAGLRLYKHIYNDYHELDTGLQSRIVSVYQDFIEFCIEASMYYIDSGARRWLKALGRPKGILDKAKKVELAIAEMRPLCDELLDKNVNSIKELNIGKSSTNSGFSNLISSIGQNKTIERLEDQIRQLLEAQEDNTLAEIQGLLSLITFSDEKHRKEIDQHRDALASDEQLNAAYFEKMQGRRLDTLKEHEDYQSWIKSEHSCLFILSGYNNISIASLVQCWVSPIAMAMITDLRACPEPPIHACYVFASHGELLYQAFSVIFLQLLRQKREVLRDKSQCDELRAELYELQKHEHQDENVSTEDERFSALHKVALRVISFFEESETVYVILDRVDRCCDLKKRIDHRKPLLKALVKMVEAARCKFKVLVVISGHQWSIEERHDELEENTTGRVIVHKAVQELSS